MTSTCRTETLRGEDGIKEIHAKLEDTHSLFVTAVKAAHVPTDKVMPEEIMYGCSKAAMDTVGLAGTLISALAGNHVEPEKREEFINKFQHIFNDMFDSIRANVHKFDEAKAKREAAKKEDA